MAATPEQIRSAIESYVRAYNEDDMDLLLSLFTEDCVWEDPVGQPPHLGHDGLRKFWEFAHTSGAKLSPQTERIVVCGTEGLLVFTMVVRMADGSGVDLRAVDRFVFNDEGRIEHGQAYWDDDCMEIIEAGAGA